MNGLSRLALLLIGALFAAAALAPWFYLAAQWAAAYWGGAALHYFAAHPFTRYFNRVWQMGVAIGILVEIRKRFRRDGLIQLENFGLRGQRPWEPFLAGLGLSLLIFCAYAAGISAMGWQRLKPGPDFGIAVIAPITGTAWGVAMLEEVFFRGYFYGLCRGQFGRLRAVWINVLFFAVVHYIRSPQGNFSDGVNWSSGFRILYLALRSFAHPGGLAGGFLVLMLVAWMLCWTVERTKNVYLAMGLHAGGIMTLKFNFAWMQYAAASKPLWMLGGGDLSQGALTLAPLALEFALLRWWLGKEPQPSRS